MQSDAIGMGCAAAGEVAAALISSIGGVDARAPAATPARHSNTAAPKARRQRPKRSGRDTLPPP